MGNQRVLKSRKPIINLDLRNSPPALSYLSTGRCKVHLICDTFIRVHLPSLHPITSCEKFLFFSAVSLYCPNPIFFTLFFGRSTTTSSLFCSPTLFCFPEVKKKKKKKKKKTKKKKKKKKK